MSNQQFPVNTGNPESDRQMLQQLEQQYAAQGMAIHAQPMPTGGYHVSVVPAGQAPMGAPMGGPPMGAPMGGPQMGAPMGGPPMGAPMGGPQMGMGGVPMGAPMGGPQMGAPMGGVPMGAQPGAGVGAAGGIARAAASGLGFFRIVKIIGVVVVVLVGLAVGGWVMAHPTLYVDNAGKEPIEIFVDGKKVITLAGDKHESLSVLFGEHKLGWAPKGDNKPQDTVKADLGIGKHHLYNPGKTACYWVMVDIYGSASTSGQAQGPQKIEEFYSFDDVDHWFQDNPEVVEVDSKKSGTTQTAVQRAKACMQFAECGIEVRNKLIECQQKFFDKDDEAAFEACGEAAAQACAAGAAKGAAKKDDAAPAASAAPKGKTPAKK